MKNDLGIIVLIKDIRDLCSVAIKNINNHCKKKNETYIEGYRFFLNNRWINKLRKRVYNFEKAKKYLDDEITYHFPRYPCYDGFEIRDLALEILLAHETLPQDTLIKLALKDYNGIIYWAKK